MCMFLQCEIITHTMGFTTKEAFHFKLQGRCWFPKSYWLKMAQLRSGRGAMNGDSRFWLPPFSSCELYCCVALKRGEEGRPCIWCFSWDLSHSAVTLHMCLCSLFLRGFISKGRWKQVLRTFCTHAPVCSNCHQLAFLAIWFHLLNMSPLTQA